jgi:nucleoside-diphosphate kinase
MAEEATLVLIKPDAIARRLAGAVLTRLEQLSLKLIGAKVTPVSRQLAEAQYEALRGKPFFNDLLKHIQGSLHGYVVALVYAGPGAVAKVREVAGATNPEAADPTSLRGALGRLTTQGIMENVLHASSSGQEAEREIKLWFRPEELLVPLYPTKTVTGPMRAWEGAG